LGNLPINGVCYIFVTDSGLKETHSYKQVEEMTGISKVRAKNRLQNGIGTK